MRNIQTHVEPQNLPPALRPGGLVQARGAMWQVQAVRVGTDCLAVDLARHSAAATRRTLLHPFDRLVPVGTLVRSRRVSRRRWIAALRGLLRDCVDWSIPEAAVNARIDILPYQLHPLLAVLRGEASRLLIADDVGLGKTIEAALILAELCSRGLARRSLVITPAGLRHQWLDELQLRFGIAATSADATWLAQRTGELRVGVNPWALAGTYVTSIDFVKQPEVLAAVRAHRWDVLIVDEAHLAAPRTDRGAAVHELASRSLWVVLLSATPHDGRGARFAGLCRTGRVGAADGPLLVFRRTHATRDEGLPLHRTRVLAVRPTTAEAHAHDLLTQYVRRVWTSSRAVDGTGARLAMTVLLKRAFSSMHALERSVRRRLHWLAAQPAWPTQPALPLDPDTDDDLLSSDDAEPDGVLGARGLTNDAHERAWLGAILDAARVAARHESKLALVCRLLARTDDPLLVFTEFRDTLARIARAIDPRTPTELLHGGQTEHERAEAIARFSSGRARVLLATDAAALGLNLQQRCRLVVNLEVPWNPNRVAQRVGRLARIGQRRRVHAVVLVARGTGEERVLDVFEARRRSIQTGLRSMRAEPASDALNIGASILDHATASDGDCAAGTDDPAGAEDPERALVRLATSGLAAESESSRHEILARRRLGSTPGVVAALARRRPWVTCLRLEGPFEQVLDGPRSSGLVLVRARLVDSSGRVWASTLVPLVFGATHPGVQAGAAGWPRVFDDLRARFEEDARRRVGRWFATARATIEHFARQAAQRAGTIDAVADRGWSGFQPGLFARVRHTTAAASCADEASVGWWSSANLMAVECEVMLAAGLRGRRPAATNTLSVEPSPKEVV